MSNLEKLRQLIVNLGGTITTRDLSEHNIARTYLKMLLDTEELVRIGRGVYCTPSEWEDGMFNIQYRFSKGVFSHGTALYLHDLSDRTPLYYDMTFPQGYNPSKAKEASVRTRTVSKNIYELGIVSVATPGGKNVFTYDIERTLCDLVKDRNSDKQILIPALNQYISGPNTNIPKLMAYAQTLKVEKKMQTYLEVLL